MNLKSVRRIVYVMRRTLFYVILLFFIVALLFFAIALPLFCCFFRYSALLQLRGTLKGRGEILLCCRMAIAAQNL